MSHERARRRVVGGLVSACVLLGLVGVTAWALVDQNGRHVVASPFQVQANLSTTAVPAAPPTAAIVTTTAPPAATNTTALPVAAAPTAPPVTGPPISVAPPTSTAPPTTTAATPASLRLAPSPALFPSLTAPYWPMPTVVVTITNTGGSAATAIVVHPVGIYSVPATTCSTLQPGQSCTADVQFCPTSPGHYVNTLAVTGEDTLTSSQLNANITLDGIAT